MQNEIRLRVALAVVNEGRILLVPHYQTDVGDVQWTIPGGKLEFCESLQAAAGREFFEETGLRALVLDFLDISEVIHSDRPYHSITVTYLGKWVGGEIRPEAGHSYGEKMPQWFSLTDLDGVKYHPANAIEKALSKGTSVNTSEYA